MNLALILTGDARNYKTTSSIVENLDVFCNCKKLSEFDYNLAVQKRKNIMPLKKRAAIEEFKWSPEVITTHLNTDRMKLP